MAEGSAQRVACAFGRKCRVRLHPFSACRVTPQDVSFGTGSARDNATPLLPCVPLSGPSGGLPNPTGTLAKTIWSACRLCRQMLCEGDRRQRGNVERSIEYTVLYLGLSISQESNSAHHILHPRNDDRVSLLERLLLQTHVQLPAVGQLCLLLRYAVDRFGYFS